MGAPVAQLDELRRELAETRARLREAEEALDAIRSGKVDAIVRAQPHGGQILTIGEAQFQYRTLLEAMGEGAVLLERSGTVTYCNAPFAELVQRPREDAVGADFAEFIKAEEKPRFTALLARARQAIARGEFDLLRPDGRAVPVQLSMRFPHDTAQESACMVVSDLSERKRGEEQAQRLNRALEQRVANLVEASVDAILSVDLEGRVSDVNERTSTLTGFARQELIGSPFNALFTDSARAAECLHDALNAGVVKDFELGLRVHDGSEVAVALSAARFENPEGKPQGIFVAVRDISERQRAEQERSLLATIVEASSDAIYSTTSDLIVTSWNRGAEKLYGFTAQEMIGRSMTAIVPLAQRAGMFEHVNLAIRGELRQFETVRRRKDGSLVEVAITISPILDKVCKVSGLAMTARDITERKRVDRELTRARDVALEAARMRSEFLANMSHEIRTPLTSIMGMTEILLDGGLNDQQRECARAVQESSEGLLAIINDILDFSRIAAGKLAVEEVDFELEGTVGAALALIAEQAHRKGLEVAMAFEPDLPRLLRGDPGRLRQVLVNLLSNAVKFTEHGEIVVRVARLAESPNEATLRFEVRDTGIGIPKEAQGRLFHAFSQIDTSDSREHGGTGLGLAIARELVERMGGTIGLKSEPGAGSTFWFTAKLGKQRASAQAPPPGANLGGLRVLVVDDNATTRGILTHQLAAWEIAAEAAAGPEEALRMLRAQAQRGAPFRVALLDLNMPVMDGLELARRIRGEEAIARTRLIILSSGNRRRDQRARGASLHIKGWLLKPVKPSELYDALADAAAEGAGARPAAAEAPQAPPLSAAIEALGARRRKLRALVVEDNATNRQVALWHLDKLGFIADAVAGGHAALEALARAAYDVVLMDCRMPKLDGYETTRQIRQREGAARHTKVVAMTAHALAGDREKCLAAGMDDYLSKPLRMEELVALLGRVLGLREDAASAQIPAPAAATVAQAVAAPSGAAAAPAPPAPAPAAAGSDGGAAQRAAAALDAATIESLRVKGELLGNLIGIFLEELPEKLAQLAQALAEQDGENAAITAHGLKGAAATFGAARMRELAEQVEQAADRRAFDGARAGLEELRAEYERVRRALEAERARPTS